MTLTCQINYIRILLLQFILDDPYLQINYKDLTITVHTCKFILTSKIGLLTALEVHKVLTIGAVVLILSSGEVLTRLHQGNSKISSKHIHLFAALLLAPTTANKWFAPIAGEPQISTENKPFSIVLKKIFC